MDFPPFKTKAVEPIAVLSPQERRKRLQEAGWNPFLLRSRDVAIDLLTDSGTGAMSQEQWAGMMRGDESYAGSESFARMRKAIEDIMGFSYVVPTHQGRGAEHVLDAVLVRPETIVPGNTHFDTTRAHIEHRLGRAVDCTVDRKKPDAEEAFLGNVDLQELERVLQEHGGEKVAYVLVTATCNSNGGQPVSMENLRGVSAIAKRFGVPFFLDAARYAENAYFIKMREHAYRDTSVAAIAKEMMSYADGCLMSAKKDAIVPIGGFIAVRDEALYRKLLPPAILFEGFVTYGGMAGHAMEALAVGLREGVDEQYLAHRVGQVARFGQLFVDAGIPVLQPFGGHAVYLDAGAFLSHIPWDQFPGHALACALYLEGGVRSVEVGSLLEGRDSGTHENRRAKRELTRLAVPRRVYVDEHLTYVVRVAKAIAEARHGIPGLSFVDESPVLRHFGSTFSPTAPFPL